MVDPANVTQLPEGKKMVRRDPALRDVFPVPKANMIATDHDRETLCIPIHARLRVPMCLPIDELGEWAEALHTLALRIQGVAAQHDLPEKYRLSEVKGMIETFNKAEADPHIHKAEARKTVRMNKGATDSDYNPQPCE